MAELTAQIERVLPQWSPAPVVEALVALRGIDRLAATVILAELVDSGQRAGHGTGDCLAGAKTPSNLDEVRAFALAGAVRLIGLTRA